MSSAHVRFRVSTIVVLPMVLCAALAPRRAAAQSTFASLTGTVTDPSGAVLPERRSR